MDWSLLVPVIVEELENESESHSCIMAASVILDVLTKLGINNAYPLTVKPRILNPHLAKRFASNPHSITPEKMKEWASDGQSSIVAIGDKNTSTEMWNGHLVVVIPKALNGRNMALDVTITQANVPEWDIELPPLMIPVSDEFIKGNEERKVDVNGSTIIYMAFPDDLTFKDTPIWQKSDKKEFIVQNILSRINPAT